MAHDVSSTAVVASVSAKPVENKVISAKKNRGDLLNLIIQSNVMVLLQQRPMMFLVLQWWHLWVPNLLRIK